MNMVYVASRFEISRRRENLSWSHHAALAALEPTQQDHWLDLAEENRLSVRCLRIELRAETELLPSERAAAAPSDRKSPNGSEDSISCPACGHTFHPA
jgi:hypothetical protein